MAAHDLSSQAFAASALLATGSAEGPRPAADVLHGASALPPAHGHRTQHWAGDGNAVFYLADDVHLYRNRVRGDRVSNL